MGSSEPPQPLLPFYKGAIPDSFVNQTTPAQFQTALAGIGGHVNDTAGALALTTASGLQLAPTPAPANDGLTELDACDGLRTSMGGLLLRSQVDAPPLDPATLAGESCDTALANAGLAFAGIVQALQSQTANLAHLSLTGDTCTAPATLAKPHSKIAAVTYDLPRSSSADTGLNPDKWASFQAYVEGGGAGDQVALHTETAAVAEDEMADGTKRYVFQRAGLGTLADTASQTSASGKAEELIVREVQNGTVLKDATLTRNVNVTLTHGPTPAVDESSDYSLLDGEKTVRHWTVTAHAERVANGPGTILDVKVVDDNEGTKSVKLGLVPERTGGCTAKTR
jgi:hypothetical protein